MVKITDGETGSLFSLCVFGCVCVSYCLSVLYLHRRNGQYLQKRTENFRLKSGYESARQDCRLGTTPESIVAGARHLKDNYKYRRANYKKYRRLNVVWYRQHEARPDCTFSCVGFAK